MAGVKITPPSARLRLTTSAPITALGPSLAQLTARKKPSRLDLVRFFAALISFHEASRAPAEFQGADSVSVPIEALKLAAELLAGEARWNVAYNAARVEAAKREALEWQTMADEIWQRHPRHSKSVVAKLIDPARSDAIRRKITKPKK